MSRIFLLLNLMLIALESAQAQPADTIAMADTMRSSGKIYVVVAVISVIFIGIIFYLFRIDQRLKKIETHQLR